MRLKKFCVALFVAVALVAVCNPISADEVGPDGCLNPEDCIEPMGCSTPDCMWM